MLRNKSQKVLKTCSWIRSCFQGFSRKSFFFFWIWKSKTKRIINKICIIYKTLLFQNLNLFSVELFSSHGAKLESKIRVWNKLGYNFFLLDEVVIKVLPSWTGVCRKWGVRECGPAWLSATLGTSARLRSACWASCRPPLWGQSMGTVSCTSLDRLG